MEEMQKPAVPSVPLAPPKSGYGVSLPSVTDFIRRFLCKLIVDVMVEFYSRCKTDPEFQARLSAAFGKLDSAQTQAENDEAIAAIQDMVNS